MKSKVQRRLQLHENRARKLRVKSQRTEASAEINVTPLVDVVLVLLIIFMLILPQINQLLELPSVAKPRDVAGSINDALKITLDANRSLSVNNKKVDSASLEGAIEDEMKKIPNRLILLSAHKALLFKDIKVVLKALQNTGVTQAGLMAKMIPEEE